MTRVRTLGLAAVMALALTALVGTAAAPASGPANAFIADEYPASVSGLSEGGIVNFAGWTASCTAISVRAEMSAASTSLEADTEGPVSCSSGKLEMNGCKFIFRPGDEVEAGRFDGSFDIGPTGCGPIVAKYPWGLNCSATIPAQNGLAASYENIGGGDVRINANATNIEHTRNAGPCGGSQTFNNGSLDYSWDVAGVGGIGLHIGNVPVSIGIGTEFEADSYPAWIDGGTVAASGPQWKIAGANAQCSDAQYSSEMAGPTSELAVSASYSGCKFGPFPARVLTNECHYVFGVASETEGSQDITCSEGSAIEILVYASKTAEEEGKAICEAKIGSQQGNGSVGFGESGSGHISANSSLTGVKYTFKRMSAFCPKVEGPQVDGTYVEEAQLNGYVAK